jgi:hypothetical protein
MPRVKTTNITSDTSLALLERHTLISCGRNALVVRQAATKPISLAQLLREENAGNLSDLKHDLADMLRRFHQGMRLNYFAQCKGFKHHRLELTLLD